MSGLRLNGNIVGGAALAAALLAAASVPAAKMPLRPTKVSVSMSANPLHLRGSLA